ncbi:peptidoglycan-binding domain-containing protein [Streptomyces sp. NPDC047829]|uniref:peptidoglycan-binding domain-containing protein n=1 Tax=Streptomyces sp. NPDC047829 TaxID=3154609 RepID=UPI0033FB7BA7
MRPRVMKRSIVSVIAVVGLAIGTVAGAGTSFAASVPAAEPAVSAGAFGTLATNNLGLNRDQAKQLQRWLALHYNYTGDIDGLLGTESWKAMQRHLRMTWDYHLAVDGIPGPNTIKALQLSLRGYGYTGPIDGIAGERTRRAFAKFAGGLDA